MKKTVKKIKPVLLLSNFLLFISLLVISQGPQPDIFANNTDLPSYCSVDINSVATPSLFNEESESFEKDYIISSTPLIFFFRAHSVNNELAEGRNNKCFQQFIPELQSDLPPPATV